MEWEKIFANDVSDKGLISQIYRSSYNSMPKTQTTQSKKQAEDLKKMFFQRRHTDSQQTHEKMHNITNLREVQLKTTVIYHLTHVRMVIIKMSTNNKCWRGCGKMGPLPHHWQKCKLVQPLWKTAWRVLRKLKIERPYDPAIPLLGIYLKKNENINFSRYMYPHVYSSITYNSQDKQATKVSIKR